MVAILSTTTIAKIQPPPSPPTVPAEILSTHNFPAGSEEPSPDGTILILYEPDIQTIDLWHALATHWPEFAGLVTLAILLIVARRCIRILRHPEAPGEPHCRNCRYCLTGLSSDKCPECGNPIAGRGTVRGRSRTRSILPHLAFALVLTTALITSALTLPRDTPFAHRYEWHSIALRNFLDARRSTWLENSRRNATRVTHQQIATGKQQQLEFRKEYVLYTLGKSHILVTADRRLSSYDLATGRRLCTRNEDYSSSDWFFSRDGSFLYQNVHYFDGSCVVVRRDPTTLIPLATLELLPKADRPVPDVWPGPDGGFLCYHTLHRNTENRQSCIAILDSRGHLVQTLTSKKREFNPHDPILSRDGRYLFTNTYTTAKNDYDHSIDQWDLSNGTLVRTFRTDHETIFFGISADDRYLLVPRWTDHDTHLDIWDTSTATLVRRAIIPQHTWINRVHATPDNQRVLLETSQHGTLILSTQNLFPR